MSQFNDLMNKKAVALTYDEERNAAPIIVASGTGYMAERIIETAQESGVPVYEDNSLATVLTQLELGSEIPEQLYQAIVDIYVYFLNFADKKPGAQASQGGQQAQSGQGNQEQSAQNGQDANPQDAQKDTQASPTEPDSASPAEGAPRQGVQTMEPDGSGQV